jgi:hypothetical protein
MKMVSKQQMNDIFRYEEQKHKKTTCGHCGREIDESKIEDEEVLLCDCYFEED